MLPRIATIALATFIGQSAAAATVSYEQTQVYDTVGETLSYSFDTLPTPVNQRVFVGIRTGGNTRGGLGIDVGPSSTEFFDITVNSLDFGRWGCGTAATMNPIPGANVTSPGDCEFDFRLEQSDDGLFITSFLTDRLDIDLIFAPTVGAAHHLDEVIVSVTYEDIPPVALPASGLLLFSGLLGFVGFRRLRG